MSSTRSFPTAGVLFVSGLFLTAIACAGVFRPIPTSVPTRVRATATAVATETSEPLYQQVQLSSSPLEEHGDLFGYRITAQTPVLLGSGDPRVTAFNSEMAAIVSAAVADFKQQLSQLSPTPSSTASTFDLHFNVISPPGNIISVKFDIQTYFTGAAHPGEVSRTATFDLEQGRNLSLEDLFIPDVDFLTSISKYCIAQLNGRDIGFQGFELGATATAGNYRNWNLAADGLMITFDEYQVAPYAAGPQTIIIPYKTLSHIIRQDGPLGSYAR